MAKLRRHKHPLIYSALTLTAIAVLGWIAVSASTGSRPRFQERAPRNAPIPLQTRDQENEVEFTFVRSVYNGLGGWGYYKSWATDWPKADRQFILGIKRLTNIKVADQERTLQFTDPEIFRYPFLYAIEVGHMDLSDEEASSLREYLERGGFLFCDDFWGSWEWDNFQRNMSRVLPGHKIVEIPLSHAIFHCYYDINQLLQVPNVGNALYQNYTHEQDGYVPHCRGIFNENGRLMVVINWNTDIGDAWEWADLPGFPAKYSTYAYQIGINSIIYAMSH